MSLTVGQLKEFLSKYDDNTKVITTSSNYELRGNVVEARVSESRVIKVVETFKDDFDNTRYSCEVFKYDFNNDEKAEIVIEING